MPWPRLGNHDTIAQLVVDAAGRTASRTSTNGAQHKVHGRVGDSPIADAGSFARAGDGACGGNGDGETMVRFLPCYQAVESMSKGMALQAAAADAISRFLKFYPGFGGAIVVVNAAGVHSAACSVGLGPSWRYTFRAAAMERHEVAEVPCQAS